MWWSLNYRNKTERKWKWKTKLNLTERIAFKQFWKNRIRKSKIKNWAGEQLSCLDGKFETQI